MPITSTYTKTGAQAAAQPAAVYARISHDPGNTLEGVRPQITKALSESRADAATGR